MVKIQNRTNIGKLIRRVKSARYSCKGLVSLLHETAAIVVIATYVLLIAVCAVMFRMPFEHWIFLVLGFFFALCFESVNTVVEQMCQKIEPQVGKSFVMCRGNAITGDRHTDKSSNIDQ